MTVFRMNMDIAKISKVAKLLLPATLLLLTSGAHAQLSVTANGSQSNSNVITLTNDNLINHNHGDEGDEDLGDTIRTLSNQTYTGEDRLASLAQNQTQKLVPNTIIYQGNRVYAGGGNAGFLANSSNILAVRPISSSARNSSGFGYRTLGGMTRMHKGMDFAAPIGTPIYATGNGVVTHSGGGTGYGRYVEIDHGNGLKTRYAHTSRNLVNVGDVVTINQHIADVGNVGHSTGPHLHYEVLQNGTQINPNTYIAMAPER